MVYTNTNVAILKVLNLTKIYGKEWKLNKFKFGRKVIGAENVSFSIHKGEIFGFLGPNGAGKTTTIRSILDYLHLQEGSVTIFGLDHRKARKIIRNRIGYVPGDMTLFEGFTGEELLQYFAHFRPIDPVFLEELKQKFKVNLKRKIGQLSKGNRQQVGLIAALASKPDLLILDEPTSGLDPLMASNLHNILKKLALEGVTIFLSSHDLGEVQTICNRVGIIKDGKIILVEEISNLKTNFMQKIKIKFECTSMPTIMELKSQSVVLSVEQLDNETFEMNIKEGISELFAFLSKYKIKRFTCEDATLEDIFLHFYK